MSYEWKIGNDKWLAQVIVNAQWSLSKAISAECNQ
jgi:hypothetical protein